MKTASGYKIDRNISARKLVFDNGAVYTEFTTTSKNANGEAITFIVAGEKTADQIETVEEGITCNATVNPKPETENPQDLIIKMFVGIMKGMGGVA